FNRAANLEHSCPAVIIGRKILSILNSSSDLELLQYAKETAGVGVTGKRHKGMIHEVHFGIMQRKAEIQQRALASGGKTIFDKALDKPGGESLNAGKLIIGRGDRPLSLLSLSELLTRAEKEKGMELKRVLTEIEKRDGAKVIDTLAISAKHEDGDIRAL